MSEAPATSEQSAADGPIHVFISYSAADVREAEALEELLKARGKNVWRDKRRLKPGENVQVTIPEALRKSQSVIVIWSQNSVESDWVRHEASYAVVEGKMASLAVAPFDFRTLPSVYRDPHCDPLDDTLADPTKLLERLADIRANAAKYRARRINTAKMPTTFAKRLFGRDAEMARLHAAWDSTSPDGPRAEKTNMVVIDAMGGTGKTALIKFFTDQLAEQGWRGAEAVYVWSFYSQGTDHKRQGSADQFFSDALKWFGYSGNVTDLKSQHAKGEALAELVREQRTLLILDGLEPLQYPSGRTGGGKDDIGLAGGVKDQGLQALLKTLATDQPGLTIVTTRVKVRDLADFRAPAVQTFKLAQLPIDAGVDLIRALMAQDPEAEDPETAEPLPVIGSDEDFRAAVEDYRGHALALTLLANYIRDHRDGDIRRRDTIPSISTLGGEDERDAFRVMQAYEDQFKRQIAEYAEKYGSGYASSAAKRLAVLYIMGLFDQKVERAAFNEVIRGAAVPELTEALSDLDREQIDRTIQALRRLGLMAPKDRDAPDALDAHPLVREYFGARLAREKPEAWRAAHGRLYEYYKTLDLPPAFRAPEAYGVLALASGYTEHFDMLWRGLLDGTLSEGYRTQIPPSVARAPVEKLREAAKLVGTQAFAEAKKLFHPEGEAGMTPLFAAIAHGCAAGRYDEAFNEVYWPRIARGNKAYAAHKLGLFGSELGAVAQFFEAPFTAPAGRSDARPGGLSQSDQALVLNLAGFGLRALGRLGEALEPMEVAAKRAAQRDDRENAASGYSSLSELQLVLGDGADARASAEDSVAHADKSGDAFRRMGIRTTLADALLHTGRLAEAEAAMAAAETLQADRQPRLPRLYSLGGYRYCDLLLARGRAGEVLRRYKFLVSVRMESDSLLAFALEELAGGRAHAALARGAEGDAGAHREQARARLDAAVDGLRNAGTGHELPRALLARAAFHRQTGHCEAARADLRAVLDDATRSEMRLFLIDARIEEALQWLSPPGAPAARPSSKACASARAALQVADDLIAETGLKRREPDLALARARLALAERAPDAARAALETAIRLIGDQGWWGLLPDLAELIETGGFDALGPDLARLQAAAAAYHRIADAAWRVHNAYAQALQKKKRSGAKQSAQTPQITDEMIDAMLADDDVRPVFEQSLKASGIDTPLDQMSEAERRNYAQQFLEAMAKAQQQAAQQTSGNDDADKAKVAAPPEADGRSPAMASFLQPTAAIRANPMAGLWTPLAPDAARAIAEAISPVDGQHAVSADTALMATAALPWYANVKLLRIVDPGWANDRLVLYYLTDGSSLTRLNGTLPPLHEVNAKAPIQLSEAHVLDYLRFFCFFVRGEEGPFYLAERLDDPMIREAAGAQQNAALAQFVRPAEYLGRNDAGHWVCQAVVYYSNALFEAKFVIQPSGMVKMLDDEPLAADLPGAVAQPIAGE